MMFGPNPTPCTSYNGNLKNFTSDPRNLALVATVVLLIISVGTAVYFAMR